MGNNELALVSMVGFLSTIHLYQLKRYIPKIKIYPSVFIMLKFILKKTLLYSIEVLLE